MTTNTETLLSRSTGRYTITVERTAGRLAVVRRFPDGTWTMVDGSFRTVADAVRVARAEVPEARIHPRALRIEPAPCACGCFA